MLWLSHKRINDVKNSVFVVGFRDEVGGVFYDGLGIFHGNAQAGVFDHGNIVVAVAAADHGIGGQPETVEQLLQRVGFVNILRHNFQEERFGEIDVQQAAELILKLFLNFFQNVRLSGDQKLVDREGQTGDEIICMNDLHLVDGSFQLYVPVDSQT